MKLYLPLFMCLAMAGCSSYNDLGYDDLTACPKVQIRQDDRAIIQTVAGTDLFKIEMIGYDGQCFFDENVQKNKAFVSPRFRIERLADTNVEDVHFSYYLETYEGPTRFLGKKTYFSEARMPKGSFEMFYSDKGGELSIPAGVYDFDMYAGLKALKEDSERKTK